MMTRTRKWLSLLLALAMVVCALPLTTTDTKATGYWYSSYDTSWYVNEGQNEYFIANAAQLAGLAYLVNGNPSNNFSGKTITLTADIDLSENEWTPIGNSDNNTFQGTFDGDGHSITGLTMNSRSRNEYAGGLFGNVNGGTIRNVSLVNENLSIRSANYVGGLVASQNGGKIENCSVEGNVTNYNKDYVGGIAGFARDTTIMNCFASCNVQSWQNSVGGIVGRALSTIIQDCSSDSKVQGKSYVGGIAGYTSGTILNCSANGNVNGSGADESSYVGGIAGINNGTILNCSADGNVARNGTGDYVGGIVGYNEDGCKVENCYFCGKLANIGGNGEYVGGIAGGSTRECPSSDIEYCYYLTDSLYNNGDTSDVGIGWGFGQAIVLSKAQMTAKHGKTKDSWKNIPDDMTACTEAKIALVDALNAWVAEYSDYAGTYAWRVSKKGDFPVWQEVVEYKCQAYESTAPVEDDLDLYIGDTFFGEYAFTETENGWAVQNEKDEYLIVRNGRLYYNNVPTSNNWQWDAKNSALYVTMQVKKRVNGAYKYVPTTYYLCVTKGKLAVSTTLSSVTLKHEAEYLEHEYERHVCIHCGDKETGWDPVIVDTEISEKAIYRFGRYYGSIYSVALTVTPDETITVKRVQYSLDYSSWKTATKFSFRTSNDPEFYVRVTDSDNNVYDFYYDYEDDAMKPMSAGGI